MAPIGTFFFLLLAITCAILFIFITLDWIGFKSFFPRSEVCLTTPCMSVDNVFSSYVNKKFNPCEDFSKFACDTYVQTKAKQHAYGSGLEDGTANSLDRLRLLLSLPIIRNDRMLARFAKGMYQSCMNTDYYASRMFHALYRQIKKLGAWPLVDPNWSANKYNWIDVYRNAYYLGQPLLSIVHIILDLEVGNERDLVVTLKKGQVKAMNDNDKKNLKKIILDLLTAHGIIPASDSNKQFEEAFDLHNKFSEIVMKEVKETRAFKTIQELKKSCPDVDWLKISNIPYQNNVALKEHEKIQIYDEQVICDSLKLIKNNERAVVNHIFIHAAETILNLFKKYQENSKAPEKERAQNCTATILDIFGIGASYIYMKDRDNALGAGYRIHLNNIVNNELKPELQIKIGNENDWINREARRIIVQKISRINFHFGFFESNSTIDEQVHIYEDIYKQARISRLDLVENHVQIESAALRRLGSARTADFPIRAVRNPDLTNAVAADAWYSPNHILISYAMLTTLSYKYMGPNFLNYGGIGYVGGHEFGHSVDVKHYNYGLDDKVGTFWSEASDKEFQKRAKCLVDEYGKAYDPCAGVYINGTHTLQENFADLHGIALSRRVYEKKLRKSNNKDAVLKHFREFTPRQMFWISTALVLCERRSKESCINWHKNDPHTIGPLRINMNIRLSQYFAKDWHCPVNSPMNPSFKCKVF